MSNSGNRQIENTELTKYNVPESINYKEKGNSRNNALSLLQKVLHYRTCIILKSVNIHAHTYVNMYICMIIIMLSLGYILILQGILLPVWSIRNGVVLIN